MGMHVKTVASGGIPVVDNTAGASTKKSGLRVFESDNGRGIAVTKVSNGIGLEVVYVPPSKQ